MRQFILIVCLGAMLVACSTAPATSSPQNSTAPSAPATAATAAASRSTAVTAASPPATAASSATTTTTAAAQAASAVRIGMGYIPDIQFAPFYVAQSKGYYGDEGLDVTFVHGSIQDKIVQTAQGQLTFVNASGDEVLLARGQDIPIKAVFQTEQQSPIAIFAKESSGITKPEDLRGKTIGVPGLYGATYFGLLGVLNNAGVSQADVTITEVGFTQATAVREDQVQAAVGYANNEPLLLEREGIPMNVLRVSEYFSLAGNNIVAGERTIGDDPELVRRFVRATARGLQDTIASPDEAFEITLAGEFVPELSAEQQPRELQKLKETIALWQPKDATNGLGYADLQQWQTTYQVLRDSGVIAQDLDVSEAFTNDLRR